MVCLAPDLFQLFVSLFSFYAAHDLESCETCCVKICCDRVSHIPHDPEPQHNTFRNLPVL